MFNLQFTRLNHLLKGFLSTFAVFFLTFALNSFHYTQSNAKALNPPTNPADIQKDGVPHPFFWDIVGPNGSKSHLMGTMHIPDPRWVKLPKGLLHDLDHADEVHGELDLSEKQALNGKLMQKAMLKDGKTLQGVLGDRLYNKLDKYLKTKGQSAFYMNRMHPKMAEMTLGLLDVMPLLMSGKPVLDEWLLQRAKKAGKVVGGVETVEEQLAALFSGTLEEAKKSMEFTIDLLIKKEQAGIKPFDALVDAYFSGREDRIGSVIEDELKGAPEAQVKAMEKLLTVRNRVMAKRVVKLLKANPQKKFVFAFGVAHFIGEEGVVNLIKKEGFTVLRRYAPHK